MTDNLQPVSFRDKMPPKPDGCRWMLSHSQARAYASCPLMWQLKYINKISTPTPTRLALGTCWHTVMEHYRNKLIEGESWADAIAHAQFVANNIEQIHGGLAGFGYLDDPQAQLLWMLQGYAEIYQDEDLDWQYLQTEVTVLVPLVPDRGIWFLGFADYVKSNRRTGQIVAGDTKTLSGRNPGAEYQTADLSFEPQFMRYVHAMRQMGVDVASFEWDAARTDRLKRAMVLEERFARVANFPTAQAVNAQWVALQELATVIDRTRNGEIEVVSNLLPNSCKMCDFQRGHALAIDTGREPVEAIADYYNSSYRA